jgi:drug/metabolite transporter (DMT)-like permease
MGLVRVAGLALIWGSGYLWIALALRGFNPVQIVFVRLLLGFLVLLPVARARGLAFPRDRRTWAHLFVAALVANAVPYVLNGIGQRTVDSNAAGVINATTPLWTLGLAFAVGADRSVSVRKVAGFLLGFVGVLVIFTPWRSANEIASWHGLLCLTAAASYAVSYLYMGRFLTNRGTDPIVLAASQLAAGSILLGIAMPVAGLDTPAWRADAVLSLLTLGVIGTGLAYVLNYRIITDDGPTVASTVTYLLPIVAVILGWLVLRETVTIEIIAGTALVLTGVALTRQKPPDPAGRS